MTQHPGPLVTPSSPTWGHQATSPGRPAPVRAATVLLVVSGALLGAATTLALIGSVVVALTGTAALAGDPARAVGRLVGAAVVVGVPLALTALHAWMALAVRAGRAWPVRVLTVLVVLGGIGAVAVALRVVWVARQSETGGTSLLVAAVSFLPVILVLGLQVGAAVVLLRPSARTWAHEGGRR